MRVGIITEFSGYIYFIFNCLCLYPVYLIPCDFEDEAACGYNLVDSNVLVANADGQWRRRGGYAHQIPPYDNTFGDDRGKILIFIFMKAMLFADHNMTA
ncbi:hypothetical protein DPMN_170527 [Dreissena polymorpha]|uniref:MAM domain-containing protein n=1 Tax=Dreissena polymorpha TaxID=45954 RepID=A0A9D4DZY7_DREPO|nr:hypothetical protein DPMN_170527 [Dreissena polymorpha]